MFLKGEVYATVLKLVLVLGIFFRTDGYARPTILTPPAVAIKSWKLRDRTPFRTTTLFHQTTPKITFDSIVSASDSQKIAHVPLSSTTVMPKASAILLSSSLISSLAMIARPVMAATKVSSSSVKVVAEKRLSFSNLIRNLLLGGASLGQLRVGDVRNNPYSLALNVLATLIFGFVPLVLLSVYVQRRFTNRYLSRMEKEIRREREYREVRDIHSNISYLF